VCYSGDHNLIKNIIIELIEKEKINILCNSYYAESVCSHRTEYLYNVVIRHNGVLTIYIGYVFFSQDCFISKN